MTLDEALQYFRSSYQLCKQLEIAFTSSYAWRRNDGWIPVARQVQINEILGMDLVIDRTKPLMLKRIAKNDKESTNEGASTQ